MCCLAVGSTSRQLLGGRGGSLSGSILAAEFAPGDPQLTAALLYCDMTTGPDGDYVRPADRLVEIRGRYGPEDVVTRFVELAAPQILATAASVEELPAVHPR